MTYLVIGAFLAIAASLGLALVFMLRDRADRRARARKMAWALTARVGLSILLFGGLLLAWKLGYLHPTGIAAGR